VVVKERGHEVLLVACFLAAIYGVGVVQAVREVREGERPQVLDLFSSAPAVAHLRGFEHELERVSWFAQALRPWMQWVRYVALADTGAKALVGRHGWWFYRPGVRYLVESCRRGGTERTGHEAAVSAIVAFRDQLATRGIRLLVVPVPGKASVYPDMLSARAAPADPRVHAHTQELIASLRTAGVEVVDLFAAFADARAREAHTGGAQLYLPRDTHWTPRGLRLAAATVARQIRDLGWAQPGTVAYDVEPVVAKRLGDVVRMLKTPRIERRFGHDEIRCERVVRRDTGIRYQDDPAAPVLVLGDSFLRIYERDEPGAAGFIAHLARALGQPLASIVNDGGASTLVRQELARKPALLNGERLVVWEFVERDIRFGMEGWQNVPLPEHEEEKD